MAGIVKMAERSLPFRVPPKKTLGDSVSARKAGTLMPVAGSSRTKTPRWKS